MKEVWKVVAAFVGVFILGSIFGGFFSLGVGQRLVNPAPAPAHLQPQILWTYSDRLDLNEAQKAKLAPLLDRYNYVLNTLRAQQFESISAVLQKLHTEFSAELTDDQKAKLEKIEQEQAARQQDDLSKRPGRGRPQ